MEMRKHSSPVISGWKIFSDCLNRMKNVWIPLLVLLFLGGPLLHIVGAISSRQIVAAGGISRYPDSGIYFVFFAISALGAYWAAISAVSYLHKRNAEDMVLALPVKRERMFWLRNLAGLTSLLGPVVINSALIFLILRINKDIMTREFSSLFRIMIMFCVLLAASYAVIMLAAAVTGSAVDTVLYSLAFFVVFFIAAFLIINAGDRYLYGVVQPIWLGEIIVYLSPPTTFFYYVMYVMYEDVWGAEFWQPIIFWLVAGAALYWLAGFVIKRRRPEIAGEKYAGGFTSRMFCVLAVLVGGLGMMLWAGTWVWGQRPQMLPSILWFLLGAAIAYLVVYLVLRKRLTGIAKNWKEFAIPTVVSLLAVVLLFNSAGIINRPPSEASVESVEVATYIDNMVMYTIREYLEEDPSSTRYYAYDLPAGIIYDRDGIDTARLLQQQVVDSYVANEEIIGNNAHFNLTYNMAGGGTKHREFDLRNEDQTRLLYSLYTEEFIESYCPIFKLTEAGVEGITIGNWDTREEVTVRDLTEAQKSNLIKAIRKDFLAESEQYKKMSLNELPLYSDETAQTTLTILLPSGDIGYERIETIRVFAHYTHTLEWIENNGYGKYLESNNVTEVEDGEAKG